MNELKKLLKNAGLLKFPYEIITEETGESKMSDGMTGQEFDFEMEPDYITILKNNQDTGVTIPIENWDAMIGAYNRIINKRHNY